jgi:hypothetical protein
VKLAAAIAAIAVLLTGAWIMASPSYPIVGCAYWDVAVTPSNATRLGFTDPEWVQFQNDGAGSTGVYQLAFDDTLDEEIFFSEKLPSGWKSDAPAYPHVHLSGHTTATTVSRWCAENTIAKEGATFATTVTACVDCTHPGVSRQHFVCDFASVSLAGLDPTAVWLVRLYREGSHTNDTYTGDVFLHRVGFTTQVDKVGGLVAP